MSPTDEKRWRMFGRLWWVRLILPVWIERLWLLVITGLLVFSLSSFQSEQARQKEGRRVAIQVLCGAEQGVINGGRDQLLRYGQRQAAGDYARTVAAAIEREAGVQGLLDVRTGTLRCNRLLSESAAESR